MKKVQKKYRRKNPKVVKTQNEKIMLLLTVQHVTKKSRFIKEQETSGSLIAEE